MLKMTNFNSWFQHLFCHILAISTERVILLLSSPLISLFNNSYVQKNNNKNIPVSFKSPLSSFGMVSLNFSWTQLRSVTYWRRRQTTIKYLTLMYSLCNKRLLKNLLIPWEQTNKNKNCRFGLTESCSWEIMKSATSLISP